MGIINLPYLLAVKTSHFFILVCYFPVW